MCLECRSDVSFLLFCVCTEVFLEEPQAISHRPRNFDRQLKVDARKKIHKAPRVLCLVARERHRCQEEEFPSSSCSRIVPSFSSCFPLTSSYSIHQRGAFDELGSSPLFVSAICIHSRRVVDYLQSNLTFRSFSSRRPAKLDNNMDAHSQSQHADNTTEVPNDPG